MRCILAALALFCFGSSAAWSETLWKPGDFDETWIGVVDEVKNGCWTNIGEFSKYLSDQLTLAGFKVVEAPKVDEGELSPLLEPKKLSVQMQFIGERAPAGACFGELRAVFVSGVRPLHKDDYVIVNPLGYPISKRVWNDNNLNLHVLDFAKFAVEHWVEMGKIE